MSRMRRGGRGSSYRVDFGFGFDFFLGGFGRDFLSCLGTRRLWDIRGLWDMAFEMTICIIITRGLVLGSVSALGEFSCFTQGKLF